jgi:hypothetical protein
MKDSRLKIFTGNSNRTLAEEICQSIGEPLGEVRVLGERLGVGDQDRAEQQAVEHVAVAAEVHQVEEEGEGERRDPPR